MRTDLSGGTVMLDALVRAHHAALLRRARALVRDRSVAEDVVQEAWVDILRALPRFQGRAPLGAWMQVVVTNRARTRAAKERRAVPLSALPSAQAAALAAEADAEARPDRALERTRLRQTLAEAIATLPRRQRAALALHDVQGLTPEDASARVGVSVAHLRVLLHRGRARLRWAMERDSQAA